MMIPRIAAAQLWTSAVVCLTSCAQYAEFSTGVAPPRDTAAASVYSAIVSFAYGRSSPPRVLYVESTTEIVLSGAERGPEEPPDDKARFEVLVTRLGALSRVPLAAEQLSLPAGTRVFHDVDRPGTRSFVDVFTFSPVAFSDDRNDALAYFTFHCAPLCGHGGLIWVRRDSTNKWSVRDYRSGVRF